MLWKRPLKLQGAQLCIRFKYYMQPQPDADSNDNAMQGASLCAYLVDPSATGWDEQLGTVGPAGIRGTAGAVLAVVIDCFPDGHPGFVAVDAADGKRHLCTTVELEHTPAIDEWRDVQILFDIDSTCTVRIGEDSMFHEAKCEGLKIPHTVCVAVCASAGGGGSNHACVDAIELFDGGDQPLTKSYNGLSDTTPKPVASPSSFKDRVTQLETIGL